MRSRAEAQGLTLLLELEEHLPALLLGNEPFVQRIVLALLWNAIGYTPAGSVKLQSSWSTEEGWVIRVKDTGVGIKRNERAHIFEPFWRGELRPQLPTANVGIGLSLAAVLAELLGGQLTLERSGQKGSSFKVRLPFQIVSDDA